MQRLLVSVVCFSLCAVLGYAGAGKDAPKIVGGWTATSASSGGKKVPDEEVAKINLVVTIKEDGKYSVTVMGKEVEAGTYKIDAKQKPIHLDLTITEGKDKGQTQLGLLKVEGDVMTVAFSKGGSKDRPKNFESAEAVEVTTFKRNK